MAKQSYLEPAKRRGMDFLRDNEPVDIAGIVEAAIWECGFSELDRPPYSPDLFLNNYLLFPKWKAVVMGRQFYSNAEVQPPVLANTLIVEPFWQRITTTQFAPPAVIIYLSFYACCITWISLKAAGSQTV